MKKRIAGAVLLCLAAIALWYGLHSRPEPKHTPAPTPPSAGEPELRVMQSTSPLPAPQETAARIEHLQSAAVSKDPAPAAAGSVTATEAPVAIPMPEEAGADIPPATVLENLRTVFRDYAARFGGNPVGNNAEITRALNGGNPKQIRFVRAEDGLRINDRGEMVDPWGTPYFFHQLAAREMEIHSAGPDRTMWTGDDLVVK